MRILSTSIAVALIVSAGTASHAFGWELLDTVYYRAAKPQHPHTCSGGVYNKPISGYRPSAPGSYPLYVHHPGTYGGNNQAYVQHMLQTMADNGFVAVAVDYVDAWDPDPPATFPNYLLEKVRCIYDRNQPYSALKKICVDGVYPYVNCNLGIVVSGHSQGGLIALLANNYEPNVKGVLGMGVGNSEDWGTLLYWEDGDPPGQRVLPDERVRIVAGEREDVWGEYVDHVGQLVAITGMASVCPPIPPASYPDPSTLRPQGFHCANENYSGFIMIPDEEMQDGVADHCFFNHVEGQAQCFNPGGDLDDGWVDTEVSHFWGNPFNLWWLTQRLLE